MRQITYNDDGLALVRSMKHRTFSRIFHDGACQFVFDFSVDHVVAIPIDLVAATQNKSDEAITVRFESKTGTYDPSEHDDCLFSDSVIDRIWIARTVLYCTDFTPFKTEEEAMRGIPDSTPTGSKLREILRTSTGGYDEIVCHPYSIHRDPSFSNEHSNLVDAGILIQIGDRFLSCFSRNNGFIIPTLVQSQQEMENDEDLPHYQLIEV